MQEKNPPLYEDNSISIVNYSDLDAKIKEKLKKIINTINVGNQIPNSNATEEGVFKDLEDYFYDLNSLIDNLIAYFKEPPNSSEKRIIGKSASIKKTLEDISQFSKKIDKINLDLKLKKHNEQIEKFCEIVENKLTHNSKIYGDFLDSFVNDEKVKLKIFSDILGTMINNAKRFIFSSIFFFIAVGVVFGIIFLMSYLKFKEYEDLKEKIYQVTQGIKVSENKKDSSITLSIAKNKKTVSINEDNNSVQITLKGGE